VPELVKGDEQAKDQDDGKDYQGIQFRKRASS